MTSVKSARVKRIAEFNDALRRSPMDRTHGQVLLSNGVIARGLEFRAMVMTALAQMRAKDFKKGNDPYGERDFNSFTVDAQLCFFKIDYYAKGDLRAPSDDPADTARTERVLTVMLADEY